VNKCRSLEVIEDGEFLVAHFASKHPQMRDLLLEFTVKQRTREIESDDFEQIKVIG